MMWLRKIIRTWYRKIMFGYVLTEEQEKKGIEDKLANVGARWLEGDSIHYIDVYGDERILCGKKVNR